ncbi:interleukin-17 receptor E-like protein [Festucalex cinctus]
MILWAALLMCHSGLGLSGTAGQHMEAERIKTCGTKCSPGLQCKTKPAYFVPPLCQKPADWLDASSLFRNLSFSTAVMCEGRQKCTLHLRIKTAVHLSKSINGVSVCSETPGMLRKCQIISISRASRRKMEGMQVQLENDCVAVSPRQQVRVTVTTLPSYCGITRSGTYVAPDCSWKDLRSNVTECITGRIWPEVNLDRKEVRVNVSDALRGQDYQVRLCHKDFICTSTGAHALIKKEDPKKSVVLAFSRPLPCLCIEGWSAVSDAPRVQVCPFKDSMEEMWHGIHFDVLEETLSWEAACPLSVQVTLCQNGETGDCLALERTWRNISRGKLTFAKVDPHPQLCMKFTARNQSWIRCPFVSRFQVWDVTLTQQELKLRSQVNATFYIDVCSPSQAVCGAPGTTVQVGAHSSVGLTWTDVHSCLHVRRIDVKYAATIRRCFTQPSSHTFPLLATQATWKSVPLFLYLGAAIVVVVVVVLAFLVVIAVHQKRKDKKMQCNGKANNYSSLPLHQHLVPIT